MHEGTVITRPRTQLIIERPRLTKLLDEAGARIILLLAPAGYGKTTLAQQWTRRQERVGWYIGGRGMIDVAGLSVGIADVLARMGEPARLDMLERVRILASRGHDARGLAKAVSGGAPGGDWLLVVDDYHYAHGAEDAEAFFDELLSLTEFRLLLTSRERPSWLPARRVVYGEAAAIEMEALAFTDAEALAVLGQEGEGIVAEARGWPAVIGLAAMRGGSEVAAGLAPEELYRFFAEDLFSSAAPALRDAMFLLALAGVDGARALLGAAHVERVAEAAERGFLTEDGGVVHPLLRGFLLTKIAELDDARIRSLVERAVEYLAGEHRWDDCLFVLEHFPQDDLILSTLEAGLAEILDRGQAVSLKAWNRLAAARGVENNPVALLAEAEIALRQREDRRAQVLGERAGSLLAGDLSARAYLAAARAAHLRDAASEARRLCAVALQRAETTATRMSVSWTEFSVAREETASSAADLLTKIERTQCQERSHELRLLTAKAILLCDNGAANEALSTLELAKASMSPSDDPFARTNLLQYLAYVYVIVAQYEDALRICEQQTSEGEETGLEFVIDYALLRRVAATIGLRRFDAARRSILELQRRASSISSFVRDNLVIHEAKLKLAIGDLRASSALLDRDFESVSRPAFQGEVAAYRALFAAGLGDIDQAQAELHQDAKGFSFAEADCVRRGALAIVAMRENRTEEATAALVSILERGQADALVTAVRAYPPLARAALRDPWAQKRVTELFVRSRDASLAKAAGLSTPRERKPREVLSPREREVYELVALGRSNREIAQTLFISESTAKVHVRHIFEKLGVRTRAEAAGLRRADTTR